MNMIVDYYKETFLRDFIEIKDKGFCFYKITGDECYLSDIYVVKDFRKLKIASELADRVAEIAKEKKCKYLVGSVNTESPTSNISLLAQLNYGFKILRNEGRMIYLIKEL